jgi:steroid delta-isomerase-like uncharacterized protein
MYLSAFPDLRLVVEDEVAEGEQVVVRYTVHATHQGTFMGMPATGKQVRATAINVLRIVGGKIVEERSQIDQLSMLQQLGIIPPMG